MAWIQFDASLERQIEKSYRLWGAAQPKQLGQIGGTIWSSIRGGPNPDNTVDMLLADAFVDELECSKISFKRR